MFAAINRAVPGINDQENINHCGPIPTYSQYNRMESIVVNNLIGYYGAALSALKTNPFIFITCLMLMDEMSLLFIDLYLPQ